MTWSIKITRASRRLPGSLDRQFQLECENLVGLRDFFFPERFCALYFVEFGNQLFHRQIEKLHRVTTYGQFRVSLFL